MTEGAPPPPSGTVADEAELRGEAIDWRRLWKRRNPAGLPAGFRSSQRKRR